MEESVEEAKVAKAAALAQASPVVEVLAAKTEDVEEPRCSTHGKTRCQCFADLHSFRQQFRLNVDLHSCHRVEEATVVGAVMVEEKEDPTRRKHNGEFPFHIRH